MTDPGAGCHKALNTLASIKSVICKLPRPSYTGGSRRRLGHVVFDSTEIYHYNYAYLSKHDY